jgi:hypothetical protein
MEETLSSHQGGLASNVSIEFGEYSLYIKNFRRDFLWDQLGLAKPATDSATKGTHW